MLGEMGGKTNHRQLDKMLVIRTNSRSSVSAPIRLSSTAWRFSEVLTHMNRVQSCPETMAEEASKRAATIANH
jgi:hypothetical protein